MGLNFSPDVNYWPEHDCARAYWSQQTLPSYRELLADTVEWLRPKSGESWLDLGCGGGRLTRALWESSSGKVRDILGIDCAAVNAEAYRRLNQTLKPTPQPEQIRFRAADFLDGLASLETNTFHGVVSGLSIQYAESFCPRTKKYTTEAYERVLQEVCRVLRSGGRFVFSVNVPNPSWAKVGWQSFIAVFSCNPLRFICDGLRMWKYGNWVKREAAKGRFHYLPAKEVVEKLQTVGFLQTEYRLSYAGQAYVFRCLKT